jgi:hypothetical protein
MDERHEPEIPARLRAVNDALSADPRGEGDWLAEQDPRDPADVFAAAEHEASRTGEPPVNRRRRRPRRLLPLGTAVAVVVIAAVLALAQLRGAPRALADPTQAAAAAEQAGTFAFESTSKLFFGSRLTRTSTVKGEINLAGTGSFKVHGVGFERIVFPDKVYARGIGRHGPSAWLGAWLSPKVAITPYSASGGGLGDPLGLTATLHTHGGARDIGRAEIAGESTQHYALTLTLGSFLPADSAVTAPTRAIPVEVQAWQERLKRLVLAVRTFRIGGASRERLVVETHFSGYGQPTSFEAPHTPLHGTQPLNATADDPLGASVLHALSFGTGHSGAPATQPSVSGHPTGLGKGFRPAP